MSEQSLYQRLQLAETDEQQIWEAPPASAATPTTSEVMHATRVPRSLQADIEDALIAVIISPLRTNETYVAAGHRREREAKTILEQLDPAQAHHLGRRLDIARPDDPIVVAFCRFSVERRARLRTFIAEAKRRAAIKSAVR